MKTKAAVSTVCGAPRPFAKSNPSMSSSSTSIRGEGEVCVRWAARPLPFRPVVINGDRPRPTPIVLGHGGAANRRGRAACMTSRRGDMSASPST